MKKTTKQLQKELKQAEIVVKHYNQLYKSALRSRNKISRILLNRMLNLKDNH